MNKSMSELLWESLPNYTGEKKAKIEKELLKQIEYWTDCYVAAYSNWKVNPSKRFDRRMKHAAHMVKWFEKTLNKLGQRDLL